MPDDHSELSAQLLKMALCEATTHALVLLDAQGKIVAWLAGAQRLFGYEADEVIGKDAAILFTPEDISNGVPAWELQTALRSGEASDDRWQLRKDHARVWVSGTLCALRDPGGALRGFIKIMRNRTDQKLEVEALQSRVAALSSGEGQKNRFISTLAHELRNPLGAVSSTVELLAQHEAQVPDLAFSVGVLRRQVKAMGKMIDDVLEMTRSAAGKIQLQRHPLVLQDIITQAIETCRPRINAQTQAIHQSLPAAAVRLNADAGRLRQVFVNLIDNAVKYTQYGGTIWIKLTIQDEQAVVKIRDTGVGISPEVMPHIFELFTQADPTGRSGGGLGIGLSVVKDAVAIHGGTVQVTSDGLGKGSEFTVRLPVSAPD